MGRWSCGTGYGGWGKVELEWRKERIEWRVKESLLLQVMGCVLMLLKLKPELTKFLSLGGREGRRWCGRRRLKCLWWSGRSWNGGGIRRCGLWMWLIARAR